MQPTGRSQEPPAAGMAGEVIDGQARDLLVPGDEITLGDPYHLSSRARAILAAVTLILVISMTALFVSGVVRWY